MADDGNPTFGGLRRQAEAILKGQRPDLEGFTQADTERLVHELQVHQIELELQNEALRQTQQALELARDEYADLYDRAPVGYMTVDGGGAIARANATAAALLGVEPNALLGQPFSRFVARDDQDAYHFFLVRLQKAGGGEAAELSLVRGDGTRFRGRVEGGVWAADRQGRPSWRAAVSDVTAEAQAREDLRLIVEGTAAVTGHDFFRALVQHLARLLAARVVLVGRLDPADRTRVHTLAVWADDEWAENIGFDLRDSACEQVARGEECFYPSDAARRPAAGDPLLDRWPAAGGRRAIYRGLPLRGPAGETQGVLVVLDEAPGGGRERAKSILTLFATRAGAELTREEGEEALRRSQERYQSFVDHSSEAIWRIELEQPIPVDLDEDQQVRLLYEHGYVAECNQTLAHLHGFDDPGEVVGMRLGQILPRLSPGNERYVRAFIRSGYHVDSAESIEVGGQGEIHYFLNSLIGIVHVERGCLVRLWGVQRDITERKEVESQREAALESLRRARDELEVRVQELSALQEFTHQVASTLEVRPLLGLMADHFRDLAQYDSLVVYGLEENHLSVLEYRGPLPREDALQARFALDEMPGVQAVMGRDEPLLIADVKEGSPEAHAWCRAMGPRQEAFIGDVRSWLGVALRVKGRGVGVLRLAHGTPDFFTSRHAQLALAFANQAAVAMENARLYAQARELAVTHERERLARDLHDAVNQTLFSAGLIADVLPRLWQASPEKALESVRELGELTHSAQAEMRTLLWELRPDALFRTSLGELLRQLGVAVGAKAYVKVTVALEGERSLPPEVHMGLYRIAQEAFNNIRKHANASAVEVSLRFGGGQEGEAGPVELSIGDDGCGFDLETASHKGLGLGNLRQRAAAIGASLRITSQMGCGTQIWVVWPGE